jgi:hypothetical protein
MEFWKVLQVRRAEPDVPVPLGSRHPPRGCDATMIGEVRHGPKNESRPPFPTSFSYLGNGTMKRRLPKAIEVVSEPVAAELRMVSLLFEAVDAAIRAVPTPDTPRERVAMASNARDKVHSMLRSLLELQHPDWTAERVQKEVYRLMLLHSIANDDDAHRQPELTRQLFSMVATRD